MLLRGHDEAEGQFVGARHGEVPGREDDHRVVPVEDGVDVGGADGGPWGEGRRWGDARGGGGGDPDSGGGKVCRLERQLLAHWHIISG